MNYRVLVAATLLCVPFSVFAAGNGDAQSSANTDAHSSTNKDAHQSALQKELAREKQQRQEERTREGDELAREKAAERKEMQQEHQEEQAERKREAAELAREKDDEQKEMREERQKEQAERNREAAELERERASEKKEMHEEHEQLRAELKQEGVATNRKQKSAAANHTGDAHVMKSLTDKLMDKLTSRTTVTRTDNDAAMNDNSGSQYMKKYAASYQHYADYQQYQNKYAGAYQKYEGEYQQYADYQKYIQRYSKESNQKLSDDAVRKAHDANTTGQLNKWRDGSRQNVQWYVPSEYSAYANSHIDKQYSKRLHELQSSANANDASGITAKDVADSAVNLAETPERKDHKDHLNATERKALKKKECEQLRQVSEEGVKKVQDLSESLKRSAANSKALEQTAAAPLQNVANAFSDRSQAVAKNVELLETQVKSGKTSANFANQVEKAKGDVKKLRDDELHALGQAHRDASDSTRHAARGAQDTARDQARHVRAASDQMARKDQSYQDQANKLQDDVEAAAEDAQNHGEDLDLETQDLLDERASSARDEVHKAADRRLDALSEVQKQFETLEATAENKEKAAKDSELQKSQSVSFLAQSPDFAASSPAPLAVLGLVGVAFACLAFWLLFFAKYNVLILGGSTIHTPPLLG